MAARITREFLDRMRDDPDFLEATPGDASEAVAIIDLAISALSHPAALERARAEERERCARWLSTRADDVSRLSVDAISFEAAGRLENKASILNEAAAGIRALGPRPLTPAEQAAYVEAAMGERT